jgi:hypothetical protein
MILSLAEITQQFPEALVEQGYQLVKRGSVLSVDVRRGGELITAIVDQGTERPLRIYIRLSRHTDGPLVHGECSCGADGACVHMVAALLQALGPKTGGVSTDVDKPDAVEGRQVSSRSELPAQCLLYLIHLKQNRLSVECRVAKRLSNGGLELVSHFDPVRAKGSTPARFLDSVDLELLPILASAVPDSDTSRAVLQGAESAF